MLRVVQYQSVPIHIYDIGSWRFKPKYLRTCKNRNASKNFQLLVLWIHKYIYYHIKFVFQLLIHSELFGSWIAEYNQMAKHSK